MSARSVGAAAVAAGTGAVVTGVTRRGLMARPPGGAARWLRTNYAGRPVSLLSGPAYVAGASLGALAAAGPARVRTAAALAGAGAGALGIFDDLVGGAHARGLRGHARALGRGELTTGGVKVVGLSAIGAAAALRSGLRGSDAVVAGALIAGTANLVNLFDLRPGRAVKVGLLAGAPALRGRAGPAVAAALGAALAVLPGDLDETSMLGDAGAGALGAVVGFGLAQRSGRRVRGGVLAGVIALTVVSEAVSFSRVIAAVPPLRALDQLGRAPAPAREPVAR